MKHKIKWRDLTSTEQAEFGNGCGTVETFCLVPEFIFEASCRQHDFYYIRGGYILDKIIADWQFYMAMLNDASRQTSCLSKWFFRSMATVYFVIVSIAGLPYFSWGAEFENKRELLLYSGKVFINK